MRKLFSTLAVLVVFMGSIACDSRPSAESLKAQFTVINEESHEDALEAFHEARIVPADSSAEGTRKALQAFHDLYWMKRQSGLSHPITRLQAWAYASESAYQRDTTSWVGQMEHMGESGTMNIQIKK